MWLPWRGPAPKPEKGVPAFMVLQTGARKKHPHSVSELFRHNMGSCPPRGSKGPPREDEVEQWRALRCYSPLSSSLCCPLSTPSPFSMPSFVPFLLPEMPLPLRPLFAFPNSTSFSLDQIRRPFSFLFKSMKCFINSCAILAQGPCYFSLYPSNLSTCAAQASTKGHFLYRSFHSPNPQARGPVSL